MDVQPNINPQMGLNSLCNYRIEKKIGKGQFSEVYRATYLLDNKLVALKKVKVILSFSLVCVEAILTQIALNKTYASTAVFIQTFFAFMYQNDL